MIHMPDRLQQLIRFFEADPTDAFSAYGIALEYLKQNNDAEGLAWLDRALDIDPDYVYAYFQKGQALAQSDRIDEARQVIQNGIETAQRVDDPHGQSELQTLLDSIP
ncbi:MAG: hypothetical protein CMJ49_14785 [Planctomycetaceae bacterium]|nr:hypothetical protein [Planctomycetaceae bacterium]